MSADGKYPTSTTKNIASIPSYRPPSLTDDRSLVIKDTRLRNPGPTQYYPSPDTMGKTKYSQARHFKLHAGPRKIELHDKTKAAVPGPGMYRVPSDFGYAQSGSSKAIPLQKERGRNNRDGLKKNRLMMTTTNLLENNMRVGELFEMPQSTQNSIQTKDTSKIDLEEIEEKPQKLKVVTQNKTKLMKIQPKNLVRIQKSPYNKKITYSRNQNVKENVINQGSSMSSTFTKKFLQTSQSVNTIPIVVPTGSKTQRRIIKGTDMVANQTASELARMEIYKELEQLKQANAEQVKKRAEGHQAQ